MDSGSHSGFCNDPRQRHVWLVLSSVHMSSRSLGHVLRAVHHREYTFVDFNPAEIFTDRQVGESQAPKCVFFISMALLTFWPDGKPQIKIMTMHNM